MQGPLRVRAVNTLGTARREVLTVVVPRSFGPTAPRITDAAGRRIDAARYERTEKGYALTFEAGVPAFGYADFRLEPGCGTAMPEPAVHSAAAGSEKYLLENDMYRIVLDLSRGGVIESLVAKRCGGREVVDPQSDFSMGELCGCFPDEGGFRSSTETPATLTVLQDDALERSVRIEGRIASHPFVQTLTLRRGERRIDFDLRIDWQHPTAIGSYKQNDAYASNRRAFYDDRGKLRVCFPVASGEARISKDAPFDVCESTLRDTYFSTWDSIKHNVLLHWVDLAGEKGRCGLALLSDHTTSYAYGPGDPLSLTVQFAGNGLWGRDYALDGQTHLRYALVPHSGRWDEAGVDRESQRWNEPPLCGLLADARPQAASLLDLGDSGYELSAVCMEGGDILLRLYNASGSERPCRLRFGVPLARIEEVSLDGQTLAPVPCRVRGGQTQFEVAMPRFGIRTFRLTK